MFDRQDITIVVLQVIVWQSSCGFNRKVQDSFIPFKLAICLGANLLFPMYVEVFTCQSFGVTIYGVYIKKSNKLTIE